MESEWSQVRSGTKNEFGKAINYFPIKHEVETETEAQSSIHPFEGSKLETIIKAENYTGTGSDGDLMASIVKTEFVEYQNNYASTEISTQIHSKTVTLEKIPKPETETNILSGEPNSASSSNKEDGLYSNYDTFNSDSNRDSNSDPELDPFAEIDSDPNFSWKPQSSSNPVLVSATQEAKLINAAHNNHSSNPSSLPSKSFLPTKRDLRRKTTDSKLKCQLCLQTQSSESQLKTHLKICVASHPESDRLRFCVPCNKLYNRAHEYRRHALKTHEIEETKPGRYPIKCEFCPRTFSLQESLVFHVASHHESNDKSEKDGPHQRPYKCPKECPSSFTTLRGLKSHLQSHQNERRFKCPADSNCEKVFKFNSSLNAHLRRVHSPEVKTFNLVRKICECKEPNCGKKFNFSSNLSAHLQRVHSLKEKTVKCQSQIVGKNLKRIVTFDNTWFAILQKEILSVHMQTVIECFRIREEPPNTLQFTREHGAIKTRQQQKDLLNVDNVTALSSRTGN